MEGFQRRNFGLTYPPPLRGQAGILRKLTEATNSITPPRIRIFHGNLALALWYAVPDAHYMDRPEARGSSRKPTEAKNSITPTRIRIFPGILAAELRYAVPDPLAWAGRKPAEAHGSPRKPEIA